MKINIHNNQMKIIDFMDNDVPGSLKYSNEDHGIYLEGGSETFELTVHKMVDGEIHPRYKNITDGSYFSFVDSNNYRHLFSITNIVETDYDATYECELMVSELITETYSAYEPTEPHTFDEYISLLNLGNNTRLSIGVNQIDGSKKLLVSFTDNQTIVERLQHLVTEFNGELKYRTTLFNDGSLNEIVVDIYKARDILTYDNGVGNNRKDINLEFGRSINGMSITTNRENQFTAIRLKDKNGKYFIPDKNIIIKNKDGQNEFFMMRNSHTMYAPIAMMEYPSLSKRDDCDNWTVREFTCDFEKPADLEKYITYLIKTHAYPKREYDIEIDGFEVLRDTDIEIGDTIYVRDENFMNGSLFSARVIEIHKCWTNPLNNRIILSNVQQLASKISSSTRAVMDRLIEEITPYSLSLHSTNGLSFKNSVGETTLSVSVYRGNKEVENVDIIWFIDDGYIQESVITISAKDINNVKRVSVEVYHDGILVGKESVSLTNVVDGAKGDGIKSQTITYGISDSNEVKPLTWGTSIPKASDGQYVWTRIITDYTNDTPDTIAYIYSKQGIDGKPGESGESIEVVTIEYQAGTSPTIQPTGKWSSVMVPVAEGQYLWTKTTLSDNNAIYLVAKQGQKGDKGASVKKITTHSKLSPTKTADKTGTFIQNGTPNPTKENPYVVTYTTTELTDGTIIETPAIVSSERNPEFDLLKQEIATSTNSAKSEAIKESNRLIDLAKGLLNGLISGISAELTTTKEAIKLLATKASVDSLTGRVSSNESSIQVQAGEIASRAKTSELNQTNQRLSTAETLITQTGQRITTEISETKALIPKEVGGHNLLRGTVDMFNGTGGWNMGHWKNNGGGGNVVYNADLPTSPIKGISKGVKVTSTDATIIGVCQEGIILEPGTYTLSVWVKGTPGLKVNLLCGYVSAPERFGELGMILSDSEWHHIHKTFTTSKRYESITLAYLRLNSPGTIYYAAPYIHKSSLPGMHSPAPEDMVSELSSLKTTITQTAEGQKQLTTQVNESKGKITKAETSITQLIKDVASKVSQSVFDSLKNTVTSHTTSINQMTSQIALKAEKSYVDSVKSGSVQKAEIKISNEGIVHSASKTVNGQTLATMISQNPAWVEIIAKLLKVKGDMIVNGAITSDKLNVSTLSAIIANLGTVTAGKILFEKIEPSGWISTPDINNQAHVSIDSNFVVKSAPNATIRSYPAYKQKTVLEPGIFESYGKPALVQPGVPSTPNTNVNDSVWSKVKIEDGVISFESSSTTTQTITTIQEGIGGNIYVESKKDILIRANNYTQWYIMSNGTSYKQTGDDIVVAYDITATANGNLYIGKVPKSLAPKKTLMLYTTSWNGSFKRFQVNSDGSMYVIGATAKDRFCSQNTWTL